MLDLKPIKRRLADLMLGEEPYDRDLVSDIVFLVFEVEGTRRELAEATATIEKLTSAIRLKDLDELVRLSQELDLYE